MFDDPIADATHKALNFAESRPQTIEQTIDDRRAGIPQPRASTSEDAVASANSGDEVTITGDSVEGDGYTWYPVELADGTTGFIVADFLELAP